MCKASVRWSISVSAITRYDSICPFSYLALILHQISTLKPLESLTCLDTLLASSNRIQHVAELRFLKNITWLRRVDVSSNTLAVCLLSLFMAQS